VGFLRGKNVKLHRFGMASTKDWNGSKPGMGGREGHGGVSTAESRDTQTPSGADASHFWGLKRSSETQGESNRKQPAGGEPWRVAGTGLEINNSIKNP